MSSQTVVLMADARARRQRAQHVRRLCWGLADEEVVKALKDYAAELEQHAMQLEAEAERLLDAANGIQSEVGKARETIANIKSTLAKYDPPSQ